MQAARNDREKGELFAACRAGQVAVLLGSTERMGVGTNVQLRAVALHHLDCPWRPADLAQRDGRLLRQGNANPTVQIHRYVAEGSFDAYLWQTVERKARFIRQVMRGTLDVREIEDIGETALSYSEVKALATGDRRILDKARADADIARLERLERAHGRNRHTLHSTAERVEQRLPALHRDLQLVSAAAGTAVDTRGDAFTITVAGQRLTNRPDAAAALRDTLLARPLASSTAAAATSPVAQLAGLTVLATALRYPEPHLRLELADVPRTGIVVDLSELAAAKPVGLISRLENRAANLDNTRTEINGEFERLTSERDRASTELARALPHTAALTAARTRSAVLAQQLTASHPRTAPDPRAASAPRAVPDPPQPAAAGGPEQARPLPSAPPPPSPSPTDWRGDCSAIDARLLDDPHWPALQAALSRAHHVGLDVPGALAQLTAQPLPDHHPARALHYRLVEVCDAALTEPPPRAAGAGPAGAASPPELPQVMPGPTATSTHALTSAATPPRPPGRAR